jgi:hypothetical protein
MQIYACEYAFAFVGKIIMAAQASDFVKVSLPQVSFQAHV